MRPKNNPFRSECIQAIPYIFQDGNWESLLDRFEAIGSRGAIVGDIGTGKSTLLNQMETKINERGRLTRKLFLNDDNKPHAFQKIKTLLDEITENDVIILDGAGQLSWWQWSYFLVRSRKASGLVVTYHQKGLLPSIYKTTSSPELLEALTNTLLKGEKNRRTVDVDTLYTTHGGNIREALRNLYDLYSVMS